MQRTLSLQCVIIANAIIIRENDDRLVPEVRSKQLLAGREKRIAVNETVQVQRKRRCSWQLPERFEGTGDHAPDLEIHFFRHGDFAVVSIGRMKFHSAVTMGQSLHREFTADHSDDNIAMPRLQGQTSPMSFSKITPSPNIQTAIHI